MKVWRDETILLQGHDARPKTRHKVTAKCMAICAKTFTTVNIQTEKKNSLALCGRTVLFVRYFLGFTYTLVSWRS